MIHKSIPYLCQSTCGLYLAGKYCFQQSGIDSFDMTGISVGGLMKKLLFIAYVMVLNGCFVVAKQAWHDTDWKTLIKKVEKSEGKAATRGATDATSVPDLSGVIVISPEQVEGFGSTVPAGTAPTAGQRTE